MAAAGGRTVWKEQVSVPVRAPDGALPEGLLEGGGGKALRIWV